MGVTPDDDDPEFAADAAALDEGALADDAAAMDDERTPFVQSLARGLAVIKAFGPGRPDMTVADVARATGLTRAAARRFLHTLVELEYMRTDGRLFTLRPRVLELGYAYISSMPLPALSQPHLEALTERTNESTSVSVLDGDDIVYVARVSTHKIMKVSISVGTRFPAYATSMGRVLLAHADPDWLDGYLGRVPLTAFTPRTITDPRQLREALTQVRADGFAFLDQELEAGLRSVAVPVIDVSGEVCAAMNVSAPVARGDAAAVLVDLLPPLQEAARALSDELVAIGR